MNGFPRPTNEDDAAPVVGRPARWKDDRQCVETRPPDRRRTPWGPSGQASLSGFTSWSAGWLGDQSVGKTSSGVNPLAA